MTASEARSLLAARRPNGTDDAVAEIAEALLWLRQQPEGTAWAHRELVLDQQVAAKLRQVMPPLDLKERILSGRTGWYQAPAGTPPAGTAATSQAAYAVTTATATAAAPNARGAPRRDPGSLTALPLPPVPSTQPSQSFLWLWLVGLAALVVAALVGLSALEQRATAAAAAAANSGASLRQFAVRYISREWDQTFDLPSRDYKRIRAFLGAKPEAVDFVAPPQLAASEVTGCKVLDWNQRPVTLVGFRVQPFDSPVHVLGIRRSALSEAPTDVAMESDGEWSIGMWTHNGVTYVALSKLDSAALRRLL